MTDFSCILFDNDGVLVDTEHIFFEITKQVLQNLGVKLSKEIYVDACLRNNHGVWYLVEEKGYTERDISSFRKERDELYNDTIASSDTSIPKAIDVLKDLRRNYAIGVVTSCQEYHFHTIHRNTGMMDCFDFVITGNDVTQTKPAPEPYLKGIKQAGVDSSKCLAVEDSERGLVAAKESELETWMIPRGLTEGGQFDRADKILASIEELLQFL